MVVREPTITTFGKDRLQLAMDTLIAVSLSVFCDALPTFDSILPMNGINY